jgi:hypothetical protein
MKWVFRTLTFHLICIFVFSVIYYIYSNSYQHQSGIKHDSFLDSFFLSTTIQASVGVSELYPITNIGKIIMILQQFILLSSHVLTLYIFTL